MAVPGQSCDNCKHVWEEAPVGPPPPNGPDMIYQCHCDVPKTWHPVQPSDWCGKWEPLGVKAADRYLHGALALQDTTVKTLLTLPVGSMDNAVMRGCQLLNTSTNDTVVVSFLDGPVEANVIGFVSCGPKTSKEVEFMPGLMASQGNNICVKLDQSIAPGYMYVTVQGFILGQETSPIIETSE